MPRDPAPPRDDKHYKIIIILIYFIYLLKKKGPNNLFPPTGFSPSQVFFPPIAERKSVSWALKLSSSRAVTSCSSSEGGVCLMHASCPPGGESAAADLHMTSPVYFQSRHEIQAVKLATEILPSASHAEFLMAEHRVIFF